jgi:hypothetical protein
MMNGDWKYRIAGSVFLTILSIEATGDERLILIEQTRGFRLAPSSRRAHVVVLAGEAAGARISSMSESAWLPTTQPSI